VAKFHFESYRRALHTLLEDRDFDLLWVHFLNMLSFLKEERFDARVILDQHNADQLMWRKLAENASMFHSLFARMNISMLQEFRATHTSLVDRVLSVSEEDASFTRSQYQPEVEVDVVPNGVDLTQFSTSGEVEMTDPVRLLFCGSMDVQMNVDAVRRFARDVFPDLRDRLNKVRFDIVGRDPVPEVISLADHTGVNVTGTVDDVLPYYRRADVMVAPFQYGGGTKLKILEALAARVPVVSTEVGVQGIDVRDGQHVLVARKLSSFADQVTELTDHPGLRRRLVENGYDLVAEKYSWDSIYGNALTGITKRKSKS
jgi:glycosyltransferase involved in cell wall biosynthesis